VIFIIFILSISIGSVGAVFQTKLKRVIIYSSISNLALFISFMFVNTFYSIVFFFLILLIYSISMFCLFSIFLFFFSNSGFCFFMFFYFFYSIVFFFLTLVIYSTSMFVLFSIFLFFYSNSGFCLRKINTLANFFSLNKYAAVCFCIIMFSLDGMPPSIGFITKFINLLILSEFNILNFIFLIFILISTLFTNFYYLILI